MLKKHVYKTELEQGEKILVIFFIFAIQYSRLGKKQMLVKNFIFNKNKLFLNDSLVNK